MCSITPMLRHWLKKHCTILETQGGLRNLICSSKHGPIFSLFTMIPFYEANPILVLLIRQIYEVRSKVLNLQSSGEDSSDHNRIISLIISSFVPSIAPSMDNNTIELSQKLHDNPAYIAIRSVKKS
jgi:hypothetical protein